MLRWLPAVAGDRPNVFAVRRAEPGARVAPADRVRDVERVDAELGVLRALI
jgi:hypothetical protein